jgi:putative MATE family efflux protein
LWGAAAVSAAGLLASHATFAFMGTDAPVTAAGLRYLLVILAGMPLYFLFAWLQAAFRAIGDARTPLRLLAVAAAVNLAVDPILIFGIGPLPPLGVAGAAIATTLAWLVAAVRGWVLLGRLGLRPSPVALLRPPLAETWRALRVGLPLGLEGALFSLIYILLTRVVTGFGTPAVAALGVGHKLEVLNYFVCAGMGAATTTLVGQNLGAGQRRRAVRCAWRALFLTCLPVGAVTVLLVAFPRAAVAVFSTDPEVVAAGATYVLLVGMTQLFMAAEVVMLGAFAGAHWTAVPAVLVVTLTILRVPLAALLVGAGWGVEAVWLAIAATTVTKGAVLAGLFARRYGRG